MKHLNTPHNAARKAARKAARITAIGVGMLFLAFTAIDARADEDEDIRSGRVIAVQTRPYRMVHEFSVGVGVLPADALYTGLTLGGSYTLHLSDLWAWEAIGFHYSANVGSGLELELAEKYSVAPTSNPEVEYLATSHLILTPLFGKLAVFNERIIQASLHLALGGGMAHFSDGFRPMGSLGPGVRIFFGQVVSTRLDVRGAVVPDVPAGIDFLLQATLSVSFNFGSVRATERDEDGVVDNTTGFEALDELYPLSNPALGKNAETPEKK